MRLLEMDGIEEKLYPRSNERVILKLKRNLKEES